MCQRDDKPRGACTDNQSSDTSKYHASSRGHEINSTAPGWVLLRGLIREARHWEGLPEQLAVALQEPARALDLPGNGAHWREASPTSIDGIVDALRQQLDDSGRRGPHRLLAISLGGMVALRWAERFPDEVQCLVMINSSLRGIAPFYQRLRPRQYPRLLSALLRSLGHEQRERLILRMATRLQADLPALVASVASIGNRTGGRKVVNRFWNKKDNGINH
ncbi:MAG: alpha/beta fold hydrolase [Halomonas sp.]|nr:alpha/beta fold hydrolase [Halomonas sp.]MCC5903794.1 alpha/beta fold hydrolase [Halomonas sp.]